MPSHPQKTSATGPTFPATSDGGAGLVFWLLIALSVAAFAPCMILPAWREYQLAELTERVRAEQADAATSEVANLRRQLDAIHNDPAVVARLARRELQYRGPGERFSEVPIAFTLNTKPSAHPVITANLRPVDPPVPVARLAAHLPKMNYDKLFCESPTRQTLLAMSVSLFVAAFAVFWPRREEETNTIARP